MKENRFSYGKRGRAAVMAAIFLFVAAIGKNIGNAESMVAVPAANPGYIQAAEGAEQLKDSELYAKGAVLLDGDSGRVLYSKNGDSAMAMASTTKIMTCIIALEYGNVEDIYTVSSYAAGQPKVHMGAGNGEQYRMGDLLYSLMLESHNDAAVILAEGVAGSVEAFASLMNQKAAELGCEHTHFVTPNGLDAQGHCTTATELAKIMKYCVMDSPKKEEFLKITQTISYTFTDLDGKRTISCTNHNAFLSMMDGALSGKTGFTGNAGYCYVGALQQGEKTLIVALLACGWPNNKTYKWSDTKKLMEYGLKNFEYRDVYQIPNLGSVLVEDGQKGSVTLREEDGNKELNYLMKAGESIRILYELPDVLPAPIDKNKQVGSVNYYIGEVLVRTYQVYPTESIKKIDYRWCMDRILELFFFQKITKILS